jgi:hypothetical protein
MSGIAHAAFIYRKEIAQKIKKSAEIVKRTGFSSRLLLASKDYINPEYHELSRKYKAQLDAEKKAIAERDKLMSPDETKALEYEDKVKEDIEAGKEIKFEDVIFADEKFTEGVPEEIAQKAKENLDQSVYKLEEEKKKETNPDRPSPQMLQKIITELTPGPAYEKTQSKALVSLATRGPEVQNQNCNARAKIIVMALERLYPKLKGKIYQQEFDDHVRILFNIDGDVVTGETYVMEEGVSLLSQSPDKDKASEINKYEDIIKKNYGGKQTPPPISVGQVDEQKDKPYPGNTDQKSGKLSGKSGKKLGNYSNIESMMDPKLMAPSDPAKNPPTSATAPSAIMFPAPVLGSVVAGATHRSSSLGIFASYGHGVQRTSPTGTPGLHSGVGGAVGVTRALQVGALTVAPATEKCSVAETL